MAKDERGSAGAAGAAVAGGTAAGLGAYAVRKRLGKRKAMAAAQEAAEKATASKALRRARVAKGGKALAGLAALGLGAAGLRSASKNPAVRKAVANRRIASEIGRGAAKSRGSAKAVQPVVREISRPKRATPLRRPQMSASERRRQGAYAASMASKRMRKVGNADMAAFSDELQEIMEKEGGIRNVIKGALNVRRTVRNPNVASKGLDPLSRIGDKYVAYANKKAIQKAKKTKIRKDRVAPVLSAIDKAFPG